MGLMEINRLLSSLLRIISTNGLLLLALSLFRSAGEIGQTNKQHTDCNSAPKSKLANSEAPLTPLSTYISLEAFFPLREKMRLPR